MASLEWELQRNLAIVLVLVMAAIWAVGIFLPRNNMTAIPPTFTAVQAPSTVSMSAKAAGDTSSLSSMPHRRFTWLFPILAGVGIITILLLQGIIIRRSFRRLDLVRQAVKQLKDGDISRIPEDDAPLEIHPLIHEFNHVLALTQERMERSRHSLGNLAHALKGPINLLRQNLDQSVFDKQQAGQQLERLLQLTERELKRARLAGLGNTTQRFNPHQDLADLISLLTRMHQRSADSILLSVTGHTGLTCDREDMLELLGNLLDNACKWAKDKVRCQVLSENQHLYITIEDDGPGLSDESLLLMTQRGTRLDESVEGYGLGLSICKDIINLYEGRITFSHSKSLGGLCVEIII